MHTRCAEATAHLTHVHFALVVQAEEEVLQVCKRLVTAALPQALGLVLFGCHVLLVDAPAFGTLAAVVALEHQAVIHDLGEALASPEFHALLVV